MPKKDQISEKNALAFENFYIPNRPRFIRFKSGADIEVGRVIYDEIETLSTIVLDKLPKGISILIPGAGANIYLLIILNILNPKKFRFILLDRHRDTKIAFYKMLALFASDVLFKKDDIKKLVSLKGNPFGPEFNQFLEEVFFYLNSNETIGIRNFLMGLELRKLRRDAVFDNKKLIAHMGKFAKDILGIDIYLVEDIKNLKRENVVDVVFVYGWVDWFLKGTGVSPLDSAKRIAEIAVKIFKPLVQSAKKYLIVAESDDSLWRMHMLKKYGQVGGSASENDGYMRTVHVGIPSLGVNLVIDASFITPENRALFYTYEKKKK